MNVNSSNNGCTLRIIFAGECKLRPSSILYSMNIPDFFSFGLFKSYFSVAIYDKILAGQQGTISEVIRGCLGNKHIFLHIC